MTFVDFSHSIFYCDVDLRGISYVRRMSRRDSIYHGKADLRSSYYGGTANLSGSVYYVKLSSQTLNFDFSISKL